MNSSRLCLSFGFTKDRRGFSLRFKCKDSDVSICQGPIQELNVRYPNSRCSSLPRKWHSICIEPICIHNTHPPDSLHFIFYYIIYCVHTCAGTHAIAHVWRSYDNMTACRSSDLTPCGSWKSNSIVSRLVNEHLYPPHTPHFSSTLDAF